MYLHKSHQDTRIYRAQHLILSLRSFSLLVLTSRTSSISPPHLHSSYTHNLSSLQPPLLLSSPDTYFLISLIPVSPLLMPPLFPPYPHPLAHTSSIATRPHLTLLVDSTSSHNPPYFHSQNPSQVQKHILTPPLPHTITPHHTTHSSVHAAHLHSSLLSIPIFIQTQHIRDSQTYTRTHPLVNDTKPDPNAYD